LSIQLVSLNDVKLFLGMVDAAGNVDTANVTHDLLITQFIKQVSARIETYLDRLLTKEERTVYFDSGPSIFFLHAYPVDTDETFTITLNGVEQICATDGIDGDFFLYADEGKIVFPCGTGIATPQALKVIWTGGYAEIQTAKEEGTEEGTGVLAVPDDLARACIMQSVYDFRRRNDLGLSSVSMPDGSISVAQGPSGLLSEVRYILNESYRRLVF